MVRRLTGPRHLRRNQLRLPLVEHDARHHRHFVVHPVPGLQPLRISRHVRRVVHREHAVDQPFGHPLRRILEVVPPVFFRRRSHRDGQRRPRTRLQRGFADFSHQLRNLFRPPLVPQSRRLVRQLAGCLAEHLHRPRVARIIRHAAPTLIRLAPLIREADVVQVHPVDRVLRGDLFRDRRQVGPHFRVAGVQAAVPAQRLAAALCISPEPFRTGVVELLGILRGLVPVPSGHDVHPRMNLEPALVALRHGDRQRIEARVTPPQLIRPWLDLRAIQHRARAAHLEQDGVEPRHLAVVHHLRDVGRGLEVPTGDPDCFDLLLAEPFPPAPPPADAPRQPQQEQRQRQACEAPRGRRRPHPVRHAVGNLDSSPWSLDHLLTLRGTHRKNGLAHRPIIVRAAHRG